MRRYADWSPEETSTLVRMIAAGYRVESVAEKLGRTEASCRQKMVQQRAIGVLPMLTRNYHYTAPSVSGQDYLTEAGANRLVEKIKDYWAKRGVTPDVWAERCKGTTITFVVRSNIRVNLK